LYDGYPPLLVYPSVFEGFMWACANYAAEREYDVMGYMEAKAEAAKEEDRRARGR